MRIKVSEASGPTLDWMVAKAQGTDADCEIHAGNVWYGRVTSGFVLFNPHRNWAQGGPITDRERIDFKWVGAERCRATYDWLDEPFCEGFGPTPLIAAMRCFVASKLGDEVEVPDEIA